MRCLLLFLGLTLSGVLSRQLKNYGYQVGCVKCHPVDKDKINVHLIPHSHDDVGWLKTVDQYYYGMNTSIQQAGVQYIITSVFEALLDNEDRRYIQVETAYFWKWWQHQSPEVRKLYKGLVDKGQIEMVNGAWSMNDEACANYQSTIDQFTWGLRTIDETVGECGIPTVGWQIDPFGHSREQASLLSQMGYDGVMFARLDHDDKTNRMSKSALDFVWKGSDNLDESTIFGSIFPTSLYFPPDGFCWDYKCTDGTVDDNSESADYNIDFIRDKFTKLIHTYKQYFPTKNIIIPMGGDFHYESAEKNYINMDRFIKAFQNDTNLNVIYSTPSCYIKAVNDGLDKDLIAKTDDFFPYSDSDHSFWTGYYSSRPNSKRFERVGHNILQATKQLFAQNSYNTSRNYDENLRHLREIMGIMQHHDAITGTEKQHVANDYVRGIHRAITDVEKEMGEVFDELLNTDLKLELASCLLTNVSICKVSQESDKFVVAVYNPLGWSVTHYVRLPVDNGDYMINEGELYDLIPTISNFSHVKIKGETPSAFELVFAAKDIPPMGFKLYYIQKTSATRDAKQEEEGDSDDITTFVMNDNDNTLQSVILNDLNMDITQNFYYYVSDDGNSSGVASGAYIFRPVAPGTANPVSPAQINKIFQKSGKVVDEVHQVWTSEEAEILQIIRHYKNESYIEFDWIIGNINITDNKGKEFISKYTINSNFNNNNVFYTDSNGRELIKRVKNKRSDYTYDPEVEPVSSNYYPVTSRIVIKDEDQDIEVAVLTDRSEGGSSLSQNELELMVHRRILHDDHKGVDENLNEIEFDTGVYVRGTHYLVIGKANKVNLDGKSTASLERIIAQQKLIQPWIGLSATNMSYKDLQKSELVYEGLDGSLPENVNILTFEQWINGTYLLRLEHIMEQDDDTELSKSIDVNIAKAFKHFDIKSMAETTLAANQLLSDYQKKTKYTWKTSDLTTKNVKRVEPIEGTPKAVSLSPMQIRTFIVSLKEKDNTSSFGFYVKPHISLGFVFIIIRLL
ncbi:lysosomal alpha-mannosidase [Diabrotica virgifera virgifera]|uniref:Alpha-mannosidase n=1 Tax=Diabrotica virgifera virgifera TaxID=50390 RepID=A0ABM5L7S2_DIAVI|nr:lysosomal alpha-mannosidase [Diabrotica virgifera virgifera]